MAIRSRQPELLELILDYDRERVNVKNSAGLTPLMYAAKHGYK